MDLRLVVRLGDDDERRARRVGLEQHDVLDLAEVKRVQDLRRERRRRERTSSMPTWARNLRAPIFWTLSTDRGRVPSPALRHAARCCTSKGRGRASGRENRHTESVFDGSNLCRCVCIAWLGRAHLKPPADPLVIALDFPQHVAADGDVSRRHWLWKAGDEIPSRSGHLIPIVQAPTVSLRPGRRGL